ncbi:hypothetical protein C8R46DRAFT_954166, partial [Mycena filopes]
MATLASSVGHEHPPQSHRETMVEAVFRQAMAPSPAHTAQDYRALVWTMKSLADDSELEPFVEGIPDLLWAPNRRRLGYEDHIQQLAQNRDIALPSRIDGLLRSCDSGLLSADARRRREITCYKAVWAMASIQISFHTFPSLSLPDYYRFPSTMPGVAPYSQSAAVLVKWSLLRQLEIHLSPVLRVLLESIRLGHPPPVDLFKRTVKTDSW